MKTCVRMSYWADTTGHEAAARRGHVTHPGSRAALSVSTLNTHRSSVSLLSTPVIATTSFWTCPAASHAASCRSTDARYVFSPSSVVTRMLRPYLPTGANASGG